jgi:hypothetical protein
MLGQHGRLGQIARGVLAGTPVAAAEVRAAAVAELETAGLAPVEAVVREADLCIGDRRKVSLANGLEVELRLLSVRNRRDGVNGSLRSAAVEVEVTELLEGGAVRAHGVATLEAGNYRLPVSLGPIQMDCSATAGLLVDCLRDDWRLGGKDARLRVWPCGAPLMAPGTFGYHVRGGRWNAAESQMANAPVHVDGGEMPAGGREGVYYHAGLDVGGVELIALDVKIILTQPCTFH